MISKFCVLPINIRLSKNILSLLLFLITRANPLDVLFWCCGRRLKLRGRRLFCLEGCPQSQSVLFFYTKFPWHCKLEDASRRLEWVGIDAVKDTFIHPHTYIQHREHLSNCSMHTLMNMKWWNINQPENLMNFSSYGGHKSLEKNTTISEPFLLTLKEIFLHCWSEVFEVIRFWINHFLSPWKVSWINQNYWLEIDHCDPWL